MPLKNIRHALLWTVLTLALLGAPSAFALEESDRTEMRWQYMTGLYRVYILKEEL